MPVELNTAVTITKEVTIPEKIAEVIDITGDIIIKTNEHVVEFEYSLYQYKRDSEGNIITDTTGKKIVRKIITKHMILGSSDYESAFSDIITADTPLGKAIEEKLIDWVKTHDKLLENIDITYIDSDDLAIKN